MRLIAEAAAAAPLTPYDHALAALLARPKPEQIGVERIDAFFGQLQVNGNGFLEPVSIEDEPPRQLIAPRPDRMAVLAGPCGRPVRLA